MFADAEFTHTPQCNLLQCSPTLGGGQGQPSQQNGGVLPMGVFARIKNNSHYPRGRSLVPYMTATDRGWQGQPSQQNGGVLPIGLLTRIKNNSLYPRGRSRVPYMTATDRGCQGQPSQQNGGVPPLLGLFSRIETMHSTPQNLLFCGCGKGRKVNITKKSSGMITPRPAGGSRHVQAVFRQASSSRPGARSTSSWSPGSRGHW
jgi:hypothetical protein